LPKLLRSEHSSFADIVGFTELATRFAPARGGGILNGIFSGSTARLDRHGLEKIKNHRRRLPGSRAACPLLVRIMPWPWRDGADMCEVAAPVQPAQCTSFSRCASASTPAGGGRVIGTHKFIFDLWGDAVKWPAG